MGIGQSGVGGGGPVRVVLDANIIISGWHYGGTPERAINLGRSSGFRVYISPYILGEVERTLLGVRFSWSRSRLDGSLGSFLQWANIIHPAVQVTGVSRDVNDDPVLACCLQANADYLVTGDNDLLALGSFQGTQIVNAAAFLEIYEELEGGAD